MSFPRLLDSPSLDLFSQLHTLQVSIARTAFNFDYVCAASANSREVWREESSLALFLTNMAPDKGSLQEETDLPGTLPQVPC